MDVSKEQNVRKRVIIMILKSIIVVKADGRLHKEGSRITAASIVPINAPINPLNRPIIKV
jgi:hypothetical protein